EAVRRECVTLVELAYDPQDESLRFEWASRDIVDKPGQSVEKYQQALAWARTACQLLPKGGGHLSTLGMALYRNGQYTEAMDTLLQAYELNAKQEGKLLPIDLAFRAMTHYRMNQMQQARETLERALNTRENGYIMNIAFPIHREAQELILGKAE